MLGLIVLTVMGIGAATMIGSDGNDQIDGEDEGEDETGTIAFVRSDVTFGGGLLRCV